MEATLLSRTSALARAQARIAENARGRGGGTPRPALAVCLGGTTQ